MANPLVKRMRFSRNIFSSRQINGNKVYTLDELTSNELLLINMLKRDITTQVYKAYIEHIPGQIKTSKVLLLGRDDIDKQVQTLLAQSRDLGTGFSQFRLYLEPLGLSLKLIEQAYARRMRTYSIVNELVYKDPVQFLVACREIYTRTVEEANVNDPIKVNCGLICEFRHPTEDRIEKGYFNSTMCDVFTGTNLEEIYENNVVFPLLAQIEGFVSRDSGWMFERTLEMRINLSKNVGFTIGARVQIPKTIADRKALINVQCEEGLCFPASVLACLFEPTGNACRLSSYPNFRDVLNLDGIPLPFQIRYIERFEKLNDISVNVYAAKREGDDTYIDTGDDSNKLVIVPVHVSVKEHARHIHLFMIRVHGTETFHFSAIKSLSRLINSQLSYKSGRRYFCDRSLTAFLSENKLANHKELCKNFGAVRSTFPQGQDKFLSFTQYRQQEKTGFIVYADLESLLEPIDTSDPNPKFSYTENVQRHVAYSAGMYVKCNFDDSLSEYRHFTGKDCTDQFVEALVDTAKRVLEYYSTVVPMKALTPAQRDAHNTATHCHICEKPYANEDIRVMDHCHVMGLYRGSSHAACNINYKNPSHLSVVIHNARCYDNYFLLESLAERRETDPFTGECVLINPGKVRVIGETMGIFKVIMKYIRHGFRGITIKIIDSFSFLCTSLEKCVSYLEPGQLKITRKCHPDDERFKLVTRKGVFPYDYIDSFERLDETSLPGKDKFYNALTDSHILPEDYAHACQVWRVFKCKNLWDYSNLYLYTDVTLLADVFENFRDLCMKTYRLDPTWSLTAPSLAYQALLRITGVRLELIDDVDIHQFIEGAIRGGICFVANRHAVANNRYMDAFDPSKPESYIVYLDVNGLYSFSMLSSLPCGEFRWLEGGEIDQFDVLKVEDDARTGYILQVDLEYPRDVHDAHSDLPFCPEKGIPPVGKHEKLLTTLADKTKYVIHYRHLKLCLANGLKLTRVHRVHSFKQAPWMAPYIRLNAEMRGKATNQFENMFFKLMNNATFGRLISNKRAYRTIKIATKWEGKFGAGNLISSPNFKNRMILSENLVIIEMEPQEIHFDMPIYAGFAILEISKVVMYGLHYQTMIPAFPEGTLKLQYTDTDSLLYHITVEDAYQRLIPLAKDYLDTSTYAQDNVYKMPVVNKGVLGKLKDETLGRIITEVIGLRAKLYSFSVQGDGETLKAKGVKRSALRSLSLEDYRNCLTDEKIVMREAHSIRAVDFRLYTQKFNRIALCSIDDKRYRVPGTPHTLPWSHYSISEQPSTSGAGNSTV